MAAKTQKQTSNFDVFKPDNQPLIARTALGNVFESSDIVGKSKSRPRKLLGDVPRPVAPPMDSNIFLPTKGALVLAAPRAEPRIRSRFGIQSQASFFRRHNPHPFRVRHIEGLNGAPVCAVNDSDYVLLPRINLSNPSNRNLKSSFQSSGPPFAFQTYQVREKAIPRIGLIPMTSNWRSELQELCVKAGLNIDEEYLSPRPASPPASPSGRKSVYSKETGRLIPPPSRSSTRQSVRSSFSTRDRDVYQHITPFPETETLMLEMLCQILETDSIQAVQQWLVAASDREKAFVLDMIKTAINVEEVEILKPKEENQVLSSPYPPSRVGTARSQQKTPILPRNYRYRNSISAMSHRSIDTPQKRERIPQTPKSAQKRGTLRLQKGSLSPVKPDRIPPVGHEVKQKNNDQPLIRVNE